MSFWNSPEQKKSILEQSRTKKCYSGTVQNQNWNSPELKNGSLEQSRTQKVHFGTVQNTEMTFWNSPEL